MKKFLVAMALLVCVPATAYAAGALALNGGHGDAYGWAVGYPSQEAANSGALSQCGSGCSVVHQFSGGCAAYAADQAQGSTAIGWSQGYDSSGEAQSAAMQECQSRGGTQCLVRAWGCDS